MGWQGTSWIIAMDQAFFSTFSMVTQRSWALDTLIVQMFRTNTAKIVPLLACIVWLLFERKRQGRNVTFFIQLLLGSFLAMTLSRVMQNFSFYRPRPLHNQNVDYQLPFGIETSVLEGWSSFPSDTSALAFAIAAGIFLASRRLGIAAFLWVVVVVAFPRAYGGLHYPSDLIAGGLIGFLSTAGAAPLILGAVTSRVNLSVDEKWMPLLWTLSFLYMFQLATMFQDIRTYGSFVKEILRF
jgi:undecaprenyl-diphosphatase